LGPPSPGSFLAKRCGSVFGSRLVQLSKPIFGFFDCVIEEPLAGPVEPQSKGEATDKRAIETGSDFPPKSNDKCQRDDTDDNTSNPFRKKHATRYINLVLAFAYFMFTPRDFSYCSSFGQITTAD
jgi:hypothetical protein